MKAEFLDADVSGFVGRLGEETAGAHGSTLIDSSGVHPKREHT